MLEGSSVATAVSDYAYFYYARKKTPFPQEE